MEASGSDLTSGAGAQPPAVPPTPHHPVRVTTVDELERSRLTVFFRLLLAIPHFVWLALWGTVAFTLAIVNWFAVLITGHSEDMLHRFLGAYVRYVTHVTAYVSLAANPFPGFLGKPGSYPIDVVIDPPERQNRWTVGFRLIFLIPPLIVGGALVGFGAGQNRGSSGVLATLAILAWFVCLAKARLPSGFRPTMTYCLGYAAQLDAYAFLLTDRYPRFDPSEHVAAEAGPAHPVALEVTEDERRSRLTVFFRLLLAIPHILWLVLWGIAAFFAGVANWFATLFTGRSPGGLHGFLAAYLRYGIHVYAFLLVMANPFPGFTGARGSYPIDVEIAGPEPQNRWKTGFRFFLALPAFIISGALSNALCAAALLGWFAALFTGRMPRGLNRLGDYALRYSAQTSGYLYLLTDRYPYTAPVAGDFALEPAPAAGPMLPAASAAGTLDVAPERPEPAA